MQARLAALGDELRFVLITSSAFLAPLADAPEQAFSGDVAGLAVQVEVSTNDRPDGAAMVASMLAQLREEHEEGAGDE